MTSLTQYSNETQQQSQAQLNQASLGADVGDVLLKVQDQLRNLRIRLSKEGSKVDVKALQNILEKAENDIKQQSDQYINHINNQVQVFPPLDEEDSLGTYMTQGGGVGLPLDNLLDLTTNSNERQRLNKRKSINVSDISSLQPKGVAIVKPNNMIEVIKHKEHQPEIKSSPIGFIQTTPQSNSGFIEEISQISHVPNNFGDSVQLKGLSPGQQMKLNRINRALVNPFNAKNRELLNEQFNIQLPLIEQRKALKMSTHLITGSTVDHLATLPLEYRRNPTLIPPSISEQEAKYGLMSLMERGLIPSNAQITFDPQPISAKTIDIKEPKNTPKKFHIDEFRTQDSKYRLDPSVSKLSSTETNTIPSILSRPRESQNKFNNFTKKHELKSKDSALILESVTTITQAPSVGPLPPPVTPTQLMDPLKRNHRLIIQNGQLKLEKQEFIHFKQFYCLHWGNIVSVLKMLENLCQTYLISVAFVDGNKVADLSNKLQIEQKPTQEELLSTFINRDDIENIINTPGRRFLGYEGKKLAAVAIQTSWRRYRDRKAYLRYRRRKWAAGVIALSWLTHVKMAKAREELKRKRMRQLEFFRRKSRELIKAWPKLKQSKRVVIHIPSLGYSINIRETMKDLSKRENYQIARLCDIIDDNVDVIYVSALQVTEETLQYYSKLFGLRSAVNSGNSEDSSDFSQRYKIVVPEALNSFPTHKMALSTLLKYSPKALNRIKNLIKGRDAYIVPGVLHHDDLHIAEVLNVPILASEPEISYLYSTKSGSKRIFQNADVKIPYGEFDIYNKQQLHECLAQEITEHLDVQRWLFKLDDECDGRGIAYIDVAKNLSCYQYALKERARYGVKWTKKWAQEATYVKILSEIPDCLERHAIPVNRKIYPTWDVFEKAFLGQGGVIEACPPSDNVTALTVSILIEPDSNIRILTSGDHIHAESQYSCWGLSFPQSSVEPKLLNETCIKIANACIQRNIRGYFDVDFVTYIDAETDEQVLWATDLNISYSENACMTNLIVYMTNGSFDSENHLFEIEEPKDYVKPKRGNKRADQIDEYNRKRYAIMSSRLYHSNLSVIHYSVFFQTCRAHGIGFDIKEKQGTLFLLIDSFNHSNLGMVTIGEDLQATLQQFSHNLKSIHHEISSENMQGNTNFLMAMDDINNILGLTNENTQENDK